MEDIKGFLMTRIIGNGGSAGWRAASVIDGKLLPGNDFVAIVRNCSLTGVVKQQVPVRSIMSNFAGLTAALPEKRQVTFSRQPAMPSIPRPRKLQLARPALSAQISAAKAIPCADTIVAYVAAEDDDPILRNLPDSFEVVDRPGLPTTIFVDGRTAQQPQRWQQEQLEQQLCTRMGRELEQECVLPTLQAAAASSSSSSSTAHALSSSSKQQQQRQQQQQQQDTVEDAEMEERPSLQQRNSSSSSSSSSTSSSSNASNSSSKILRRTRTWRRRLCLQQGCSSSNSCCDSRR
ncbi:hypothetical protein COO60DRAFT_1673864 [Scenedesmus sp. NREL 46B-D3]|nr:hypothetical protein COO60DRAFT_1673864 [Scenedesmus sp. NREL 46B-D3]